MADTSALDTPITNLTPTDTTTGPIANTADPVANTADPAANTADPAANTATDSITGNKTNSSSSYSDSSNGNQVAVLSTLDYSTNLTIVNSTQNIIYNTTYNYSSQAAASTSSASANALAQPTASNSRLKTGLNFRRGRVDMILGFDPTSGMQLALSSNTFRGIDEIDFRSVSTMKALKNASRSSADVIYMQPQGKLFFNANAEDRGYGPNGGLFAILDQSPVLTASHFLVV